MAIVPNGTDSQYRQILVPQGTLAGGQAETQSNWTEVYLWFSFANVEQTKSI